MTNYLSYVGGKSGPADSSLPPVTIGYVNEQGDANPPGPLATVGAQMAVTYINDELGGVDGHPLKLDTCFTTTEQQGTSCAQQLLAAKVPLIATGGVAVGAQSLLAAINGQVPVIDGVAVTPFDAVAKNTFILFGDATHVLGPMGTYANMIGAKTATVIYPQNPGIIPGAEAIQKGLQAAGVTVTMEGYPETATSLTQYLVAGHASDRRHGGPVRRRRVLREPGQGAHRAEHHRPEEDRLRAAVPQRHGHQGPGRLPQVDVLDRQLELRRPDRPGHARLRGGDEEVHHHRQRGRPVGDRELRRDPHRGQDPQPGRLREHLATSIETAAKAFKGPQALGAPALDCGSFSTAPAVCNDRAQFFEYMGKNVFTKVAGWLQPVTPSS